MASGGTLRQPIVPGPRQRFEAACECGESILVETNDVYTFDETVEAWKSWHEEGAWLAGRWHRAAKASTASRPCAHFGSVCASCADLPRDM